MFALFMLVAGTHFAALLSPGPDFFLLIRTALTKGRRQADGCACGIALANLLSMLLVLSVQGGLALVLCCARSVVPQHVAPVPRVHRPGAMLPLLGIVLGVGGGLAFILRGAGGVVCDDPLVRR